jgi:hypothetical protein
MKQAEVSQFILVNKSTNRPCHDLLHAATMLLSLIFHRCQLAITILFKLNIDLPYDPAIPLLRIYPKECDLTCYRGTCTPMFIAALFTIAKLWKQPRCPTTGEWIKKMW